MVDLYSLVLYPLIYILPAYIANATPVVLGAGKPIDRGKKLWGKPIFGPNKTVRGLVAGLLAGIIVGWIESFYLPYMLFIGIAESIGTHFGDLLGSFIKRRLGVEAGKGVPFLDQYMFLIFALVFALPIGTYLPPYFSIPCPTFYYLNRTSWTCQPITLYLENCGQPFISNSPFNPMCGLNQSLCPSGYTFYTFNSGKSQCILGSVPPPASLNPGLYGIIFLFLITGLVHVLANRLAFMMKLKGVPW